MANTILDDKLYAKVKTILDKYGKNIDFIVNSDTYSHTTGLKKLKNLLSADSSIAFLAVDTDWTAKANITSIERIVIADEGIVSTGLPSGILTAYKIILDGTGTINFSQAITLANVNKHFASSYMLAGSVYSATGINVRMNDFTSGTKGNTVDIGTPNTTTWQRGSQSIVADSGDLAGNLELITDGAGVSGDILYATGLQYAEESSLSAYTFPLRTYTVKSSPPMQVTKELVNGDTILTDDVVVYLSAKTISGLFTPTVGMQIAFDNIDWIITDIKSFYSGDIISAYRIIVRQ